jgi:hypothetical protein
VANAESAQGQTKKFNQKVAANVKNITLNVIF